MRHPRRHAFIDAPQAQVTAMFLADTAMRQIAAVPLLIVGFLWRSRPQALPLDPEGEVQPH